MEAVFSVWSEPRLYNENQLPCVSPEAEERPLLKAVTKQRDWEHWSLCNRDL
jgi:hypothetical protein